MKNLPYIFLFIFALLIVSSCDEDSFTSVVEIEIPEHDPLPAISAQISNDTETINVLVSKSKGISESGNFEIIEDAEVNIFKNDALWQSLFFDSTRKNYSSDTLNPLSPIPTDGATYRLEVSAPGFEKATATQVIPNNVTIQDLTFEEDGTLSTDGERADEVTFKIVDQADVKNYYGLQMFVIRNYNGQIPNYLENIYFDTVDPSIQYGGDFMILDDDTFDGNTYTIRAAISQWAWDGEQSGDALLVRVHHLTRDEYLYNKTLELYWVGIDNPFAEPVVVHDNIENGYGLFRMRTSSDLIVEF